MPTIELRGADVARVNSGGSVEVVHRGESVALSDADYAAMPQDMKDLFANLSPQETSVVPVQPPLTLLHTTGTLLAGNANESPPVNRVAGAAGAATNANGFIDVSKQRKLLLMRNHAGGVYALDLEWSRDGAVVDIVETVAVANNTSLDKWVAAVWVRPRVRNTDATVAFTAHRTTIFAS